MLIFRGIDFPKTHDVVVLFNLTLPEGILNHQVEKIQPLNRYSVEARYPGFWDPIDKKTAIEAVEIARSVREAVRLQLPKNVLVKED